MKLSFGHAIQAVTFIAVMSISCNQAKQSDLIGNWKGTMDWSTRDKGHEPATEVYIDFIDNESSKLTQFMYSSSTPFVYNEKYKILVNRKELIIEKSKENLILKVINANVPIERTTKLIKAK